MKFSSFFIIFGFAVGCINASIAQANPGCLKVIKGKAITDRAAKLLPQDCQEYRKFYLKSLLLISNDPKKFSREISKNILTKKSFDPPYDAILISTFSSNLSDEIKSAIHTRAQIESSKKIKFKYAMAAESRFKNGVCDLAFSEPAYDEICKGKDLAFIRIEKLQGVKK